MDARCSMQAFIVDLSNRPGEFARVAEAVAGPGLDIIEFCGATWDERGSMVLVTNDAAATRRALGDAGCVYREAELVVATMANRPGSLATLTRRMADAGVNVDAAMPVGSSEGKVQVAFATTDPVKASEALAEWR
jgi:hypothetical protein